MKQKSTHSLQEKGDPSKKIQVKEAAMKGRVPSKRIALDFRTHQVEYISQQEVEILMISLREAVRT